MTSMTRIAWVATLAVATVVASAPSYAGSSRSRAYYTNSDGVRVRAPYTRVYTGNAVRVRAPTTSVAVDPGYGGGVRVRAPYTNIVVGW